MRTALLPAILTALSGACERPAEPRPQPASQPEVAFVAPDATPATPRRRPPPPAPSDMPSTNTCVADSDCSVIALSGPNPAAPCCDATLTGFPITRAYLEWVPGYRATNCADVECPGLPLPGAQMTSCGYQPRCDQGRCGNTCAQPTVEVPPPPSRAP